MSQITKPIILDETGQDIATAISSLANRANDIENFTSSDVADGSATAWTSVTPLASGEVHSSIFAKISQMFKNIRYLYKMLGTTNISSIGGGTVTGAISALNSKNSNAIQLEEGLSAFSAIVYKKGQYATLRIEMNNVSPSQRGWITLGTIPEGYRPYISINCVAIDNNANVISEIPLQLRISESGVIQFYCFDASKSYKPLITVTYLQDY